MPRSTRRQALEEFLPAVKVESVLANREKNIFWPILRRCTRSSATAPGTYDINKYGKIEDPVSALVPSAAPLKSSGRT